ncbi:MarR family winged helix-turn-helix transcriptional regulator [Comamonas composti]|uniref:MarR family winged helix-turn-helix transcriptional regulator n=1 Tax=Comamonas composti TaxID=408558 RepID=UPI0004259660|nr:MarR family winged helix-turn-helix transcriptional regulator [Comamonas composti]
MLPDQATPGPEPSDFYRPDSYVPFESAGFLMRKVLSSILQQADAQLAEQDLTYVQWLPLYHLLLAPDSTSAHMARCLGMDPAAVTRALDRLEAKSVIRRERSTKDRRIVHLSLTDEGRALAAQVPRVLARVLNHHLAGFSQAECELLLSMLKRMLANGEAMRTAQSGQD